MWIFGYGSIIWRPSFAHTLRCEGYIEGWTRRFWQGSPDHRGMPGAPGRVVTLVDDPESRCWGVAYKLDKEEATRIIKGLDLREKGGYAQRRVIVHTKTHDLIEALVYIAGPENEHWLGPANIKDMAAQIATSHGPSGSNAEYLLQLAQSMRQMEVEDPHVFELERSLKHQFEKC